MRQIVLMYHDIYLESETESGFQKKSAAQYKLRAGEFEKQVESVTEYCKEHPDIKVQFTFDDGGISFATLIAPILNKYGVQGIFFISTKYLNTSFFLKEDQLRELVSGGHQIGSHSCSHKMMTSLSEKEIETEWAESVRVLKDYVPGIMMASVPEGYTNKTVVKKAQEAGIAVLYTSEPTTHIKKIYGIDVIGRYVVHKDMTVNDVISIVAKKKKRKLLHAKWRALYIIKAILGKQYDSLKSFFLNK